jgi:tetratricopeptide (TPR) repeat protein
MGMNRIWRSWMALFLIAGFCAIPARPQQGDSQVQQLHAEAKADEDAGHLDAAIQKYREILRLQPNMAAGYNNIGSLYYRTMQLDEAITALKRACEIEPNLVAPRALLGFSYYQRGNFQDARRELTRAKQLAPADGNIKLFLARSLIELGDLQGAQVLLEQIRQQNPDDEEALYTLGSLYSVLAESAFGHIQKVAPDSYLLELLLGKASEARQIYADAAEHYKLAIARAPENPELYYHYGHALVESGNPAEALAAYKRALELNPYDAKAAREEAGIVVEENPEEAFKLVNRSLELQPDNTEALIVRGRALLALNKPQDAIADLKKASSLNPGNATIHFQLARAYRKANLTAEAQSEDTIFERLQKEASEETQQRAQKQMNQNDNTSPVQNAPPH